MTSKDLPITITEEQRRNPYIVSGLAQRVFRLAGYDMSPDNPVETAFERGLLKLAPTALNSTIEPPSSSITVIKRMPGNGSFA